MYRIFLMDKAEFDYFLPRVKTVYLLFLNSIINNLSSKNKLGNICDFDSGWMSAIL